MKTNNFSKLSWEPCEIFHNTAYAYTKRCIIGVPVYKSKLKETEKASLNQLCKIIGHSYEICLICPDNIELNDYIDIAYSNGVYLSYLFCGNEYFKSTETYSYMLETPDFYKCFNEYDYLMIYQLDGWIFVNFLDYYISLNVDYIGSPWISYILNFGEDTVGNGGVSLRKVQKFIDVCSKLTKDDYLKQHVENEDLFFCKTMRKQINLKFADIKNASNFSLQSDWNYFIKKYNNNHLPMCLHAWNRDYRVLKKYIEIKYDNSKHLTNDKITYDNLTNYQKFKNLNFVNRKEKKVEKQEIDKKEQIKKDNKQMITNNSNFFTWSSYLKQCSKINLKQEQPKKNIELENNIKQNISVSDKIIVSFTSWTKRISKCAHTIELMLSQTLLPNKIILNLSTDEFVNKEKDLPTDLIQIVKNNKNICEIYWVKENTKPYKKLIPTLKRFPNDVIITVDDDIEYPLNFIDEMYREYLAYDKQCPITGSHYKWENDIYVPNGGYNLIKSCFFGDYLWDLYENLYLKNPDDYIFSDLIFAYALLLNGKRYKVIDTNMTNIRMKTHNNINALTDYNSLKNGNISKNEHKLIREYIFKKYGKTYNDLFDAKIHVNLTTWKMRDSYVPIMLENFKKQTIKPDKIILWLSRDEYDEHNLPLHLQKCLDDGLLTDIMWVDKNIYCHKRHECFKYYNDVYNVFIDDDILYEPNFLEEIVSESKKYQNCITCTAGKIQNYVGTKRIMSTFIEGTKPSINNQFLGCWMCFPPYSFPLESYKLSKLRDKYIPKCDEGWLVAWFIKKGIKVNLIHDFGIYKQKTIGESQKNALYNENKQIKNGIRTKEIMFANAIICVGVEKLAHELWPKFNIYKCCCNELKNNISKYDNL